MKKLIVFSMLVSMITVGAFAQFKIGEEEGDASLTVSGFARGTFAPIVVKVYDDPGDSDTDADDIETYAGVGDRWGSNWLGSWVTVTGVSDKVSFQFDFSGFYASEGEEYWGFGDHVYVQLNPIDMITIRLGKTMWDDLRGKVGLDDDVMFAYVGGALGPDTIFKRMDLRGEGPSGVLLIAKPIPGLSIAAGAKGKKAGITPLTEAEEFYAKGQVQVGYDIAGIGLARVQFIGDYDNLADKRDDWEDSTGYVSYNQAEYFWLDYVKTTKNFERRIEAAFKLGLSSLPDLVVDLGFKAYLPIEGKTKGVKYSFQAPFEAALGAKYTLGNLGLAALIDLQFAGHNEIKDQTSAATKITADPGASFGLNLAPTFDIGFGVIGAEIAFWTTPEKTIKYTSSSTSWKTTPESESNFGIGAWFRIPYGDGLLQAGVTGKLLDLADANAKGVGRETYIAVPVILNYGF